MYVPIPTLNNQDEIAHVETSSYSTFQLHSTTSRSNNILLDTTTTPGYSKNYTKSYQNSMLPRPILNTIIDQVVLY